MPSRKHECHLLLFQNQPGLAARLIRDVMGAELPPYAEARVASAALSNIKVTEYRADMVIEMWNRTRPVYGIVVEVQLRRDIDKPFVWPAYVANLRVRLRCPVSLLVITPSRALAREASERVQIDAVNSFRPYVLGPSAVPIVSDDAVALENPELAVLSAMAHGRSANAQRAVEIAIAAQKASLRLDADRSSIYCDLIELSLSKAARSALKNMDARTYVFKSDTARHYIAVGKSQGEAQGRASLILRLLTCRFGELNTKATARVQCASIKELEAMGERLLTAATLREALGSRAAKRKRAAKKSRGLRCSPKEESRGRGCRR